MSLDSSIDIYSILGLSHEATEGDIERAYKDATKRFHPDVNSHDGARLQFEEITEAYRILSDRSAHNKYRRERVEYGKLPSFNAVCTTSKRVLSVIPEAQVIYVLVEITAKRLKDDIKRRRPPINLSLVLDRSTSMSGERLSRVKLAANQIIDQLRGDDRISVVTFSDYADVLIPSTLVENKQALKAPIAPMNADGATEIFKGLSAGYEQVSEHYNPDAVNHIIMLTDGRTFGDEDKSLELADTASEKGISISAMGLGDEWNDDFLDDLAARTGGASAYINSPSMVTEFMNAQVRNLGDAFAERMLMTVAPEADVVLESAFRLSPTAQPLSIDKQPINLGLLEVRTPISVLLQFQMPANMKEGFRPIVRLDVTGDIINHNQRVKSKTINDLSIDVAENPQSEIPPKVVVEALRRMSVARLQDRAQQAVDDGDSNEATRHLQNLATRLNEIGETNLATRALNEARRVATTNMLSEEGRKELRYGTRSLLPDALNEQEGK